MGFGLEVKASGPLFNRPRRVTRKTTELFIRRLVEMGEQRLDGMLAPRPRGVYLSFQAAERNRVGSASTGHYRRNVNGKVQGLKGEISDGNVVYGPWLEGISSRNSPLRFPGYAAFRKTGQWLNRQVKNEARKFIRQLASRMNGV